MSVQSTVRRAVALALEGVTGPAISLPASRVAAKAAGRAAEKVVGRAAGGDVRRSIRRGVERAVRRAVRGAVRSGYGREIAGYVGRAVGTAVGKTVGIAVVRSVSNAVGKEVATAVGRAIGRLVRKTVKKTIGKEVRKNAEKIARKITERAAIEAAERKGGRRDAAVIGVAIGRAIGRVFGKTVGKAVGKAAGRVVGKAIGRAVGIAVGKAVGRAVGHTMGTAVGGAVGEVIGKAVTKAIEKTIGRKQRYFAGVTSEDALMLDLKATNIIGNQVKDFSASSDIGESDLSIAESGNVTIETVESDFISDTGTTDLSTSTNKTTNGSLESDVTDFIRSGMSIVEERKQGNMKNENGENTETNDMGTISETFVRIVVQVVNADSVKYSKATPWSVIHTCGKAVKRDDIETLFDANNHSMALEHCLGRKLDSEVKMEKAIFVGDLEEFFRTNNEVSTVVNSTDLEEIYLPIDLKAVEGCSKVYTGGNKTDNPSVYEEIRTGVPIQGISADTGQRQTHANTVAYSNASPGSIIHTFSRRVQRENIETLFDAKNHSMALEHCLERKLDSEVNVEKTNLITNVDFIRTNNGDSLEKLTGDLDSFSVDMKSVGEGCSKFYSEVNKTTHSSVSEETLVGVQFEEMNSCLEQRQIHADANPVTYFKAFTCSVIHTPSKDVEREDIETFVDANNHSMAKEHCFESKLESEVNEENSNCIVNVGNFVRTNNVASSVNSAGGLEEDSLSIDMKSIAEGCSKFYAGSKTVTSSVFEETLIDVTIEEIKADLGQLQIHADSDPVTYSKASTCSVEKDDSETLFYARNHSMALTHFFERKFDSEANVEKNNFIANLEDFIKPNNGDGSVNLPGNLEKDLIPIDMIDVAEGCRKLYAEKVYKTATSSLSEETLIGIPFEEINTDLRQRQIHADVDLDTHSEASTCSVILTPNEEAETDDIETLVDPNKLSMDIEPCFGRKLDSELKVEKNNFVGDMKGFIRTNNAKRTKNLSLNLKEDSLAIDIKAIAGSCSKSDAKENETATNEYMEGLSLTSNLNALYEIFDNISNAEIFTDVASNPYTISEVENLNLEDTPTIDLKADLHTNTSKITKTGITDPIIVCTGRISKATAGKSLGECLERNMTEELDITDDIVVEVSDKSIDSSCSKQAIALIADSRPKRPKRDPEEIFQPINTELPADTPINSFADNLVTSYTDSEELIKLNDEAASRYVTKKELEENIQTTFLNAFNESICTEKIEGESITTSLVSTDCMESVCETLTEAPISFVKLFREECTSEDDRKTINTKVTQVLVNANFDASNSETESIDETLLSCSALEFVEKVCSEEIDTFSEKSDSKSVFTISDKTILEIGKSNSDVIIKKNVTSDLSMTLQSSKIYVDEGIEVINETVINTGIVINTHTLGMDGGDTPEKKEAGTAKRCPIIPIEDIYKLDNNTVSVSTSSESPTEKLGLGQGDETPHPQNEEDTHVDSVDMSTSIANEIIDNIISRVYEKTMLTKNVSKLKDIADVHLEENSSQMSLKVNKCLFKRSNKWKDSYGIRSNWRKHSRKEVWKSGNPWSQD